MPVNMMIQMLFLYNNYPVRVFDRWTCNQTCFNAARALKPLNNGEAKPVGCVEVPIGSKVPDCDFCTPLDLTAAGKTVITHV